MSHGVASQENTHNTPLPRDTGAASPPADRSTAPSGDRGPAEGAGGPAAASGEDGSGGGNYSSDDDSSDDDDNDARTLGILNGEDADREFAALCGRGGAARPFSLARERRKQVCEMERRQRQFDETYALRGHGGAQAPPGPLAAPVAVAHTAGSGEGGGGGGLGVVGGLGSAETVACATPEETWMVINVSHVGVRPYSTEPGVRMCGAFVHKAEASAHGKRLHAQDPRLTVFTVRRGEWFPLLRTIDHYLRPGYGDAKRAALLERHREMRAAADREFQENVAQRKTGKTPLDRPRRPGAERRRAEKERAKARALRAMMESRVQQQQQQQQTSAARAAPCLPVRDTMKFPRDLEVRSQRYAVVAFLQDSTARYPENAEPLFMWIACFDDQARARAWIDAAGAPLVAQHNIECVDLYEWLWPLSVERNRDNIPEHHLNPTLNAIMNRRKIEKNKVRSFKEWCARNNMVAPVTEVARDGTVRAIDMYGRPYTPSTLAMGSDDKGEGESEGEGEGRGRGQGGSGGTPAATSHISSPRPPAVAGGPATSPRDTAAVPAPAPAAERPSPGRTLIPST
jgi:hypothetical protein